MMIVSMFSSIKCFITLAQTLEFPEDCCPGFRVFVAFISYVIGFCMYIFGVLTRIKLAAFSNLLNFSYGNVKQMGASVST
jgi:hypothetical protein